MPVEIILAPQPIPGIDFPVDHDTYPNDCENVACTKMDGQYRPGTWVIITNEFDEAEEEFIPQEYHVCNTCNDKAKKSFNGMKIFSRRQAEPILKKVIAAVHARIDMATSTPLTWVKKPKQEKKEEKSFMEEIKVKISQPKPMGLPKPQPHRLPKIPKEPRAPKDLVLCREKRMKNDRNAANPRPRPQIRQQMTRKEYDELLHQKEQKEKEREEERFQEECERELHKQRNKEYLELKDFLEFLEDFKKETMRWVLINHWIKYHQSDTLAGVMALKHHGKTLSHKERNKLKHALNGNMATIAVYTALATAAITWLARRSRTHVVETRIVDGVLVAKETLAVTPPSEVLTEVVAIGTTATDIGTGLHAIVEDLRVQNEALLQRLQNEQQEHERRMAAEHRHLERLDRENDRTRTRPPELKVEPPEFYEGEATEVDSWLRWMTYYFVQVRVTIDMEKIAYAIQRVRKGKGNQARNWANGRIHEIAQYDEERAQFAIDYPGRTVTVDEMRTVIPAVEAIEGVHPAWPEYEFVHKHPFTTWNEFAEEMRQYFLTTETHAEAVKKLRELRQGDKTIEEFIIEFKGWAQLARFDRIALVDQFKQGINVNLGRRIIELGTPGDGTDPAHLQKWYDRATKLERQRRDAEQYYGKRETFQQKKKKWNKAKKKAAETSTSTDKPKPGVISVKVKDENAMDVDTTKTTTRPPPICYSCGKKGHIAQNCKGKE
ncbi:hypothetical protein AX14_006485 [Amanita brunnescens Koide BX004]|nr:hypothetical protein AX14_006485 [Amanita brunnescens Koide BX004]